MNGGLIHNKKFNLVAFLSMGLFLLIGFIDIFSWIFIMLPVVVCFYVYDIRHGAVYLTSGGHCPKFCVNGNRIQL